MKNVHALRKKENGEFESILMILPDSVYKQIKYGVYGMSPKVEDQKIEFSMDNNQTFFLTNTDIFTEIQMLKQNNNLDLQKLKEGDSIAFGFNYHGGAPKEIIVDKITKVYPDKKQFLVHFLDGHHSLAEFVNFSDVIAIGDNTKGDTEIEGWRGKFRIMIPFHPLLKIKK